MLSVNWHICIISRFVPYIGIVTILMNDYPKFKVSWSTPSHQTQLTRFPYFFQHYHFNVLNPPVFSFCSTLFSSCWVSLCWSTGSEMPKLQDSTKDKARPGNLSHAFQNRIKLDFVKTPTGFFVPFVWTFCRNVDRVFTFEKSKL